MNWGRVGGNWKQLRGKLKEQLGRLTDDERARSNGKRGQLLDRIQECYGISRDQAEQQVKEWESLH